MAFDHDGNFRQDFFDEFFDKNDQGGKGGLTLREGLAGIRKHKFPWDIFGQVSDAFECKSLGWLGRSVLT